MLRKTNLFYTGGQDTNFITFSNYGESLTSVLLDPNAKLFPTRFLCLNIPELNSSSELNDDSAEHRTEFIMKLVSEYEARLAFLRDYCVENDEYTEKNILPLNYLLETIINNYTGVEITYIGNISEQDYNGSYTDLICTIDNDNYVNVVIETQSSDTSIDYNDDNTTVYGWGDDELPEYYKNKFEKPTSYKLSSTVSGISYVKNSKTEKIEFNVIIPLYDIYNSLHSSDYTNVVNNIFNDNNNGSYYINLTNPTDNSYYLYNYMIPYGIWFSGKEPVILNELSCGGDTYRSSWSVVLSTQFKPFPYGTKLDPTSAMPNVGNIAAFSTFAEIMKNQNDIIDKLNNFTVEFAALNNKINSLQHIINGTTPGELNADSINETLRKLTNRIAVLENIINDPENEWVTYKINN